MASFFSTVKPTIRNTAIKPPSLDTIYTLISLLASEVLFYQVSNKSIQEAIQEAFKNFPKLIEIESLTALLSFDSNFSEISAILSSFTKLNCDVKDCLREPKVLCKCCSNETYLCNDHIMPHTKLNYEHKINKLYFKVENIQEASISIQTNIFMIEECIKEVVNFSKECISKIKSICLEQLQGLNQMQGFYNMKLIEFLTKNKVSLRNNSLNILTINLSPEIFLKHIQKELLKKIYKNP